MQSAIRVRSMVERSTSQSTIGSSQILGDFNHCMSNDGNYLRGPHIIGAVEGRLLNLVDEDARRCQDRLEHKS